MVLKPCHMKRTLLLWLAIAFALPGMAQVVVPKAQNDEVKKVAILKVVDEYNAVSPGVKLNLRQTLTVAINEMDGYEGYTRVNLSAITDEHAFERSGYVSDKEIKELGRMNGVDYVLVAEVAPYSEGYITLAASIYDVETGRIFKSSEGNIASIEPSKMTQSAREVAHTLLKGRGKKGSSASASSSEIERNLRAQGWVDLGLSVYWKGNNESSDFYTYDQAVSKFGRELPTKEQFEELKNKCRWTWTGNGYNVTGPSGKTIYLPATGYQYCNGGLDGVGSYGSYWSSTPHDSDGACYQKFHYSDVSMDYGR